MSIAHGYGTTETIKCVSVSTKLGDVQRKVPNEIYNLVSHAFSNIER